MLFTQVFLVNTWVGWVIDEGRLEGGSIVYLKFLSLAYTVGYTLLFWYA